MPHPYRGSWRLVSQDIADPRCKESYPCPRARFALPKFGVFLFSSPEDAQLCGGMGWFFILLSLSQVV